MLQLRPAREVGFWAGVARRVAPAQAAARAVREADGGSGLALLRDGARLAVAAVRRVFWWQRRLEAAFHASGAAAQLADAALAGESTAQLATRIARIARDLSGGAGAAVYLRGGEGLQLLGTDGAASTESLAEIAMRSRSVQWSGDAAAVPLQVGHDIVGALALRFDGAPRDLRPLRPLLSRAGAVLAAAEREARKDRFLSLAAHELKTPLTSIKGFSYSLARRLEKGEPCDMRHVQVLERQAERLHGLLEEMLEVSRIETGRFVLHQEPCEMVELVEASRRALRRLGIENGVAFEVEPTQPLFADRERIERAMTALVLHARSLAGEVQVTARRRDGVAELRVGWSGVPLQEGDPFAPRWDVPQAQRQGLGMALWIARRAAELHGGTATFEPHALSLSLPLRPRPPPRSDAGEGRLLVVDDDEGLARMLSEFLAEHGYSADWAASGPEALAKMQDALPDALVLDLRMPGMDGRALLRAVRALGFGPRVVLLSADREVASAARELACEAFVEKPFSPDGLLETVRRVLARADLAPR